MSKSDNRERLAQDVVNAFAKIGEVAVSFNDPGEWISATLNITSDPQGEAPIISMVVLPGTTKENALRIQHGLPDFFKNQ